MTSRVTWAIVGVTWAMLLIGGVIAYLGIHRTLTEALDDALAMRAAALPRLVGVDRPAAGHGGRLDENVPLPPGDRFVIRTDLGQTIARSAQTDGAPSPRVVERQTVRLADGTRLRSVSVAVDLAEGGDAVQPAMIVYSTPMDALDAILLRLMVVFLAVGAGSAIGAVVVARWVARRALAPVNRVAEALAGIDESSLGAGQTVAAVDPATMPPELRTAAQRLREMLARLDEAARHRRRFLADAAHELRTPVAALMTTLEVALRRPHDPATLRDMLQDALGATRSMGRLVEALLEHARGALMMDRASESQPIAIGKLLDTCISVARGLGLERNVTVQGVWPVDLEVRLPLVRLRSIVLNLLGNAVTYARPGGQVRLEAGLAGDRLRLVVSDDGPGIPAEHLPHIFEPFYRAAAACEGQGESHHGLGLFLVASHVQAMGGTCQVQSEPGQGARFEIELPGAPLSNGATGAEVDNAA